MNYRSILLRMAQFKVNTGCREQEVCGLRWEWEVRIPELNTSVFCHSGSCGKKQDSTCSDSKQRGKISY